MLRNKFLADQKKQADDYNRKLAASDAKNQEISQELIKKDLSITAAQDVEKKVKGELDKKVKEFQTQEANLQKKISEDSKTIEDQRKNQNNLEKTNLELVNKLTAEKTEKEKLAEDKALAEKERIKQQQKYEQKRIALDKLNDSKNKEIARLEEEVRKRIEESKTENLQIQECDLYPFTYSGGNRIMQIIDLNTLKYINAVFQNNEDFAHDGIFCRIAYRVYFHYGGYCSCSGHSESNIKYGHILDFNNMTASLIEGSKVRTQGGCCTYKGDCIYIFPNNLYKCQKYSIKLKSWSEISRMPVACNESLAAT